MAVSNIDIQIARKKMVLKNKNFSISFISTLWKNEVIMCCFSNASNKITDVYCKQHFTYDDLAKLEELIKCFLEGG